MCENIGTEICVSVHWLQPSYAWVSPLHSCKIEPCNQVYLGTAVCLACQSGIATQLSIIHWTCTVPDVCFTYTKPFVRKALFQSCRVRIRIYFCVFGDLFYRVKSATTTVSKTCWFVVFWKPCLSPPGRQPWRGDCVYQLISGTVGPIHAKLCTHTPWMNLCPEIPRSASLYVLAYNY